MKAGSITCYITSLFTINQSTPYIASYTSRKGNEMFFFVYSKCNKNE